MSSKIIPHSILYCILILIPFLVNAQSEKVIVDGGLQIGNVQDAPAVEGTIRWNPTNQDFEGYNGIEWVSLTFSPDQWGSLNNEISENSFIASDNPMVNANFGSSIDADGDYFIIGEPGQEKAYIIKKTAFSWELDTVFTNLYGSASYGNHVAISDSFVMVSANDSVKIFLRIGNTWNLQQTLGINDGFNNTTPIKSVDLKSNTAIIGASDYAGIYERTGSTWSQVTTVNRNGDGSGGDVYGISVGIYDTVAVVGSFLNDGFKGAAYVYHKQAGSWNLVQKITRSNSFDLHLGSAVAVDKTHVYIGIEFGRNPLYIDRTGVVEVFEYNAGWNLVERLFPPSYLGDEYYGRSLDVDGSTLIIGAPFLGGFMKGSAYFYKRIGSDWYLQSRFVPTDGTNTDKIGLDTAVSGNCALISGHEVDYQSLFNSGKVYLVRK